MKTRAMTELSGFKTRITIACASITELESRVQAVDQPFDFPTTVAECIIFIAEKTAEIEEIKLSVTDLLQNLRDQIQNSMNFIGARKDQTEREKMMNDLDSFLSEEANNVEIRTVRWTSRLKYRQKELEKQSDLIRAQPCTSTAASLNNEDTNSVAVSGVSTENRMRLPQLEVPAFHGNYRDYPTFWTTYNTLIHSNQQLSTTDKFLLSSH